MTATEVGGPDLAVEVRDLHMRYGSNEVLRGLNLCIAPGEVVALLGPNGAGKTTTVEILEGFRAPSAGKISVLGQNPLTAKEAWRARVGVVLQSWRDHPKWRVRELLANFGEFYRPFGTAEVPRPWDADDLLARVGLADNAKQRINRLSGGQRRRMDVAIGLIGRPEMLFLDEPTAGLDPQARRDFHDLIGGLADLETTVLLTTHDLGEAEKVASRILILAGGQIVADGSPDALRRKGFNSEVQWEQGGSRYVHSTDDPVGYLRELLAASGPPITDLEVRRGSLEDAYLRLVTNVESGKPTDGILQGLTGGQQ